MKTSKKIISLILSVLLIASLAISASAIEIFDEARAKTIAADFIKITTADMKNYQYSFETVNNVKIHELEFIYNGVEFDFEINSMTGAIKDFEYDANYYIATSNADLYISIDEAVAAALKATGVSAEDAMFTKRAFEIENYVAYYDIEFLGTSAEYEVQIRALTGETAKVDTEPKNTFIMFFIRIFTWFRNLFGF